MGARGGNSRARYRESREVVLMLKHHPLTPERIRSLLAFLAEHGVPPDANNEYRMALPEWRCAEAMAMGLAPFCLTNGFPGINCMIASGA